MQYTATADTDIGIVKGTNQDSMIIRQATYNGGNVLMAVICDGMGGLSKGELASATVIRAFYDWFNSELQYELVKPDMEVIGGKWANMLKALNRKISDYARQHSISSMGTTFTGILLINGVYTVVHVGDTRCYMIHDSVRQLTEDHTFVAREIQRGTMTRKQARTDKRRNLLLQCIGASENVEPQVLVGTVERGAFMLCSDGFRHEITDNEIFESLNPVNLMNKNAMHNNARYLIELNKKRGERDNISVILIKVE